MKKNRSYFPGKYQFYGRRKGYSISESRLKLINELLPKLLIDLDKPGLITPSILFNKGADVWLEVGFGAGEHLVAQAERYPDIGFIGCEPYINGVARVLSEIRQKSLTNILLHNDDARQVLEKLAPASISKVFILFSDPWPKKRHHRRRFINYENLNALSRVMKNRANLRFVTDDMSFVRWALNEFHYHPDFVWLINGPEDWRNRHVDAISTRYEEKAIKRGQKCIYLTFQRYTRNK
jgi:tRNA (guanine-N7-)-methyltransferase